VVTITIRAGKKPRLGNACLPPGAKRPGPCGTG
jgi:hypothetical protein